MSLLEGRACLFFDKKPRESILQIVFTMIPVGKTFHIKFVFSQAAQHCKSLQAGVFPSCGQYA